MLKNKSGAMEIVLLVLLVVLVTSASLFIFITSDRKAEAKIYDARFIEGFYQKQELAEFYIKQVGEDVIEKNGASNFKENFKTEFGKYNFEEDYLKELKKLISEDKFNVLVDGEILEIVINEWEVKDSFEKIQVTYTPEISVGFDLKN